MKSKLVLLAFLSTSVVALSGFSLFGGDKEEGSVSLQRMADAMFAVMEADRANYTKEVVHRMQNVEKIVDADEFWEDKKALPLPAQMFRLGAERVAEKDLGFTYGLLSQWPINKQNKAKTKTEKEGLAYIAENAGENFYGSEKLGSDTYFTAVYPDVAVSKACVSCHNEHKDSPRTDFKLGDTMGAVVIRIKAD